MSVFITPFPGLKLNEKYCNFGQLVFPGCSENNFPLTKAEIKLSFLLQGSFITFIVNILIIKTIYVGDKAKRYIVLS